MNKQLYKFLRPSISQFGSPMNKPSVEEMQYKKMEFSSDADANKYARWVLGYNCFAVRLDEEELKEYQKITIKMSVNYS